MLVTIEKKSLLKVLATCSCCAIIILSALLANVSAATITINFQSSPGATVNPINTVSSHVMTTTTVAPLAAGTCLYSIQLATDPALKAAFTTKISAIRGGAVEESDELIYQTNIEAGGAAATSFNGLNGGAVDTLSNDCLSCHDGVTAPGFNVRIKNSPGSRVLGLENIIGGHPVGMEYERYVAVYGNEYKSEVKFSNEMVFAEGKVGCLTCHNPLNTAKGHLVMNNSRSELCFACHNK